jgi:F-type H+-transporting ATPase subunit b
MNLRRSLLAALLLSLLVGRAPLALAQAEGGPHAESATAEHESGPMPLTFDPDLAVYTAIIFLLLVAILSYFAWPTIAAALDERERHIADNIAAAEAKHEAAKRLLAEHEAKLNAAASEVRALMDEARRDGETAKAKILTEAKQAAQDEANRAKREIELAKNAAVQELAVTSANLAVDLAGKAVGEKLTADHQARIVQDALGKLAVAAPSNN